MPNTEVDVRRWRGLLPQGTPVSAASLNLARTRTTVTKAWVEAASLSDFVPMTVGEYRLDVAFNPVLEHRDQDQHVTVAVEFIGDAPRLSGVTINGDKPVQLEAWRPEGLPDRPSREVLERLWELERRRLSAPVTMTSLGGGHADPTQAAAQEPPPLVQEPEALSPTSEMERILTERLRALRWDGLLRRVFYEHDLDTNELVAPLVWNPAMANVSGVLNGRIQSRVRYAQGRCTWPRFDALPAEATLRSYAEKTSAHFRRAFLALDAESRDDLRTPSGAACPTDLFDWAFEHFVTGQLVTYHNDLEWQEKLIDHGAPNGFMFLQFAEFAIYCLESGIDEAFWRPRLRTLVRCSHIFLESAAPLLDPPYPKAQTVFLFNADRYYPRERRAELRAEYEGYFLGYGRPWAEEFDHLRARFSALVGAAFMASNNTSTEVGEGDILPTHRPVLRPQGVGADFTLVCETDDDS